MTRTFRLGLFVTSTLVMLAVATFLIGDRQFLFSSMYRVQTTFKNSSGLVEGAEVRVGGIHKGIVRSIRLPDTPEGAVTIGMDLHKSTLAVLKTDSVATIGTEGLLGSKFIEISFGTAEGSPLTPGATLTSESPVEMNDLVKKADAIGAHLEAITDKINSGQGTLGALVNDRQVFDRINSATSQASQGAAAFKEDMEALKHNFFLRGYFNDRGYTDSTRLDDHLISQLPRDAPLQAFHYDVKKVFVDADHARLKNENVLNEAGRYLEKFPFGLAVVVASSGPKGDSAELKTLLQARAMVVRDYLVKSFKMDDTRVKTMALGKTAAGNQMASDSGTVDVIVYPTAVKR